jgi:hypothetical protein
MKMCRVCGRELFPEPLLKYENVPAAAQAFPDQRSLSREKGADLEVYQCSGCGLSQLINDPVPYYREVIRAAAFSEAMKEFRLRQFHGLIDRYDLRAKKIIEIGCGRGEYLSILNNCGVAAYGLEYSEESVGYCETQGLSTIKGYIDSPSYSLKHAPFDAFFILNYLEHLPDLTVTFGGIRHNLAEKGLGFIEVPNFDMMVRDGLFSEFVLDHLYYFTKETLDRTLSANGFDVIECDEIWNNYILSTVVRKRERLDLSQFHKCRETLTDEIIRYVQSFAGKKIAVWGAGHQALTVLSLADLADKIAYVVDSAVFKQGKYTPATHIPIVSPDRLETDPVDAIIIMAAGYSDEVAEILRQKMGSSIPAAILRGIHLEIVP